MAAAACVVLPALAAGPAAAASCASARGVSVVVDFHELGGGVQSGCDAGGSGEEAAQQFTDLGHTLTYAQRQPGFVCRVDAVPASDPCVNTSPADAYWALWWSDGTSGTWTYSSLGAGSLKVPEGGSVAFSWSQGSGQHPPGVPPAQHDAASTGPGPTSAPAPTHAPTRTPTATPPRTPRPTREPTGNPTATTAPTKGPTGATRPTPTAASTGPAATTTSSSGAASASARPSSSPMTGHSVAPAPSITPGVTPGVTPGETPTTTTPPTAVQPTASAGGLPAWVPVLVIVGLLIAAATAGVVRRRRGPGATP